MFAALFLFVAFSTTLVESSSSKSSSSCNLMTSCAVEKCLDKELVRKIVTESSRDELFGNLVEKFDMVCIAAKCGNECAQCKHCHYALEQMSALAQGEKTSGLCPKLESCVFNCLTADVAKVLSCVATRCNVHCYDGDCPSCRMISRRIFSTVCKQHAMTTQPQIEYEGTCPNLFMELADLYVAKKQKE
uniref:Protein dct-5 n=1 Tax=Caenorhabditis japonica TaxID=281687 RepID=A0A8R1DR76_CAEJA